MTAESYAFNADIYCAECAEEMGMLKPGAVDGEGNPPYAVETEEQGTADAPQHCGACHVFLENLLTDDGVDYVIDALRGHGDGRGIPGVLSTWADFYADDIGERADIYFDHGTMVGRDDFDKGPLLADLLACAESSYDDTADCEQLAASYIVVAHPDISMYLRACALWDDVSDHDKNTLRMLWLLGSALRDDEIFYVTSLRIPAAVARISALDGPRLEDDDNAAWRNLPGVRTHGRASHLRTGCSGPYTDAVPV